MKLQNGAKRGLEGLRAMQEALVAIKDEQLWRDAGYASWNDYLRDRWSTTERQVQRLEDVLLTVGPRRLPVEPEEKPAKPPAEPVLGLLGEPVVAADPDVQEQPQKPLLDLLGPSYQKARLLLHDGKREFHWIALELGKLQRHLENPVTNGAGRYVNVSGIQAQFANLIAGVNQSAPESLCPYCYPDESECRACGGSRWVNKHLWHAAPPKLKQPIIAAFKEAESD